MITDPIADLLTRIRNSVKAGHAKIAVPHSKLKLAVLEVLKKRNFINAYKTVKSGSFNEIEVDLNPSISELHLRRISKPGQRIYVKKTDIKPVLNGYGISILSTPRGVMTGDEAKKSGIGGEMICEVW
jgi:small subunit ribosomal protein S8